jgi:hypothetical protein
MEAPMSRRQSSDQLFGSSDQSAIVARFLQITIATVINTL